ncbi:hypothetical protein [Anaerostipes sp.]|uniref:hypothetical protein n=1 Tax=Anaerostipes sp. TaxID=1872530 RepID=UPI0025BF4284|nr:hypothetical protein [Anaerostipes sp.]MBS7008244.1 hypothetical protein [Anaerostipes sp.]
MKKSFLVAFLILLAAGVFSGCSVRQETQQKESGNQQNYFNEVSKAQKIQVISLEDKRTSASVRNKDEIRRLIEDLKIEQWKAVESVPEGTKTSYRCDLYQAGTQKLNQKKPGSMRKMGSLTFYKDSPYASMKVLSLRLNFKIPVDATQILEKL